MNIDTDTQYAFTRPAAAHMFTNYDGVLKVDGEVGNKKAYDPRAWGKLAEAGMAKRVVEACEDLRIDRHLAQRLTLSCCSARRASGSHRRGCRDLGGTVETLQPRRFRRLSLGGVEPDASPGLMLKVGR